MPEMALVKYYNACDLVLDQFGTCHTFGLIAPKAMACGTPVLLSYDPGVHEWCFEEQPPVIQTNDTKAIYDSMSYYLTHQDARKELSRRCRKWVVAHHSKSVIVKRIEEILASIDNSKNTIVPLYDSLKQKKLELTYEAAFSDVYDDKYHGSIVYQTMDEKLVGILKKHIEIAGLRNPHVLDLGCGPGSLTEKLSAVSGIKLTGVDISPAMIHQAKARFPEADFFVDDMEALSFDDGTFDVVFCSGVLHHLPVLDLALKEIRRVLKTNGIVVLREPNADNFASRFPQVAFAGLCLRHFLLYVIETQQLVEPEAHGYHRAFDFLDLAEELGRFFRVIDFQTDMKTSYFYDMLRDPAMKEDVERVDQSLGNQPGLNMVFVAKKTVVPGIEDSIRKILKRTKSHTEIDPAYFRRLYEFADSIFKRYHSEFYEKMANVQSIGLSQFVRKQIQSKDILLSGDDLEYCCERATSLSKGFSVHRSTSSGIQNSHGLWDRMVRLLKRLFHPNSTPKHFDVKALEALCARDRNAYDIGLFYVRKQIALGRLVELLQCVKDYGFICVEAKEGSSLLDLKKEHLDYLNQMTVLRHCHLLPGTKYRMCLTRYLYSPRDFYKALFVALEIERTKYLADLLPSIDQIIADAKQEWGARSAEYGNLEQVALPFLIRDWLAVGDPRPTSENPEGHQDS
jgi:ubiquinone/menaquinone biosynthesis C-methylase UbiE